MGRPKQLLSFRGQALAAHAAGEALAAAFDPVLVVVGAEAQAVVASVARLPVRVVQNADWPSGMGSSISAGVEALPKCDAVTILLVDQPLVNAAHLLEMRGLFSGEIVAARYNQRLGVPAIFPSRLFPALAGLRGQEGARSILRDPGEQIIPFDLPEAGMDIDTPEDWAAFS
jgi:molybdenum cofactor cytidylyltransferase